MVRRGARHSAGLSVEDHVEQDSWLELDDGRRRRSVPQAKDWVDGVAGDLGARFREIAIALPGWPIGRGRRADGRLELRKRGPGDLKQPGATGLVRGDDPTHVDRVVLF